MYTCIYVEIVILGRFVYILYSITSFEFPFVISFSNFLWQFLIIYNFFYKFNYYFHIWILSFSIPLPWNDLT